MNDAITHILIMILLHIYKYKPQNIVLCHAQRTPSIMNKIASYWT
jgi:hypothetical protein